MFANFFGLRHWQLISSAPTVIYQENSRLFSKQMWQISNNTKYYTWQDYSFQNSSGIDFNIYSHIKSLCAYSHNILTEWDKSSLRGSACKWSLVFSVKMPPNMIWNTKYHLWHLFPLGIWISLLRKLLRSCCCCCWEAVEREEGQWRTISISAACEANSRSHKQMLRSKEIFQWSAWLG